MARFQAPFAHAIASIAEIPVGATGFEPAI